MTTATNDKFAVRTCFTHEFRVSFPELFEPKKYEDNPAEFSVTMLFEKDIDLSKPANGTATSLKGTVVAALKEKWGPKKEKWPEDRRSPIRDGAKKSDWPGYEDCLFVKATAKATEFIEIYGPSGSKNGQLKDPTAIYSGCYARAMVLACPYEKAGNRGVKFKLLAIQKTRDGTPLGGGSKHADAFTAIEGYESEDNTEASDDTDDYDV